MPLSQFGAQESGHRLPNRAGSLGECAVAMQQALRWSLARWCGAYRGPARCAGGG
jgi:hypothetical protein